MSGSSAAANRVYVYDVAESGLAAGHAAIVIDASVRENFEQADEHWLDFDKGTVTSGTWLVEIKMLGSSTYKVLRDEYGANYTPSAASPYHVRISIPRKAIRITPQSLNGTWGYSVVGK